MYKGWGVGNGDWGLGNRDLGWLTAARGFVA